MGRAMEISNQLITDKELEKKEKSQELGQIAMSTR